LVSPFQYCAYTQKIIGLPLVSMTMMIVNVCIHD